jgi:hypothetical protein
VEILVGTTSTVVPGLPGTRVMTRNGFRQLTPSTEKTKINGPHEIRYGATVQ